MYINTATLTQHSEQDIRVLDPNTSFPVPFLEPEGYAFVFPAPQPTHDPITQRVQAIAPELTTLGHWEQRWSVAALDAEAVAVNEAAALAQASAAESARIEAIWQGAYDYEFAQISGVAIGMLVLGVLQSKPKALAVKGWSQSIWTEYYTRKANGSTDASYTALGDCPHTVPELMVELGL